VKNVCWKMRKDGRKDRAARECLAPSDHRIGCKRFTYKKKLSNRKPKQSGDRMKGVGKTCLPGKQAGWAG